jgi:hypothetical protein
MLIEEGCVNIREFHANRVVARGVRHVGFGGLVCESLGMVRTEGAKNNDGSSFFHTVITFSRVALDLLVCFPSKFILVNCNFRLL